MVHFHFEIATGTSIGLGHAGRCAALAQALLDRGCQVAIEASSLDGGLLKGLATLPLGTEPCRGDWLIVDTPHPITVARALALQSRGIRLCLIDNDGPGREHADVLVDPPTSEFRDQASAPLVQGPDAVLVRPEFSLVDARADRDGPVVVSFGGTGDALTRSIAIRIASDHRPVIAVGPCQGLPTGIVHVEGNDVVASAMSGASLVVTAFGHTVLEAAAMHVPSAFGYWPHQDGAEARGFADRWNTGSCTGELTSTDAVVDRVSEAALNLIDDRVTWHRHATSTLSFHTDAAGRLADRLIGTDTDG